MSLDEEAESDQSWDDAYFAFILDLSEVNESRYESQAHELVERKSLSVEINGTLILYKLHLLGCSTEISKNQGESYIHSSWSRMGWRKRDKLANLPLFFATSEADLLFNGK